MRAAKKRPENKREKIVQAIWLLLACVVFTVAMALYAACTYIEGHFDISIVELLYTIAAPMKGANMDVVSDCIRESHFELGAIYFFLWSAICVGYIGWRYRVLLSIWVFHWGCKVEVMKLMRRAMALVSVGAVIISGVYGGRVLGVGDYIKIRKAATTLYEDYYIDPKTAKIEAPDKRKNLICIYLESMETTYANEPMGNCIPGLTALAKENVSFSNSEGLGGFRPMLGTNWTMAALFSTTAGIPFSFPIEWDSMNKREKFASGVTTLGDILEKWNYKSAFLCGSDGNYAGRKDYFMQHGNYDVFDYYTTRDEGYIPEDYYVWWGFEDMYLYQVAKDKITELSQGDQPFNFTMLTVDTHYTEGYICGLCQDQYEIPAANVVACADRQVTEFVEWCKQQDFYEDTVIVIVGDHPRMDNFLVEDDEYYYDRTVYNCFLNCDNVAGKPRTQNREYTSMDIFPTTLSALGFKIEGERLGLGTNLFSNVDTLTEELGFEQLNTEVQKYSPYYIKNFA